MSQIGLFFGTTTGKTESVAEIIQKEFGGENVITLYNIAEVEDDDFDNYQYLIIGCPTWNIGELQNDWEGYFTELDNIDLSGKKVAYFGTGDAIGYADNFQDALGILYQFYMKMQQIGSPQPPLKRGAKRDYLAQLHKETVLEEKITELGGNTVGYWSTDGYEFNESKALKNGKFVGLALDEDNQPELTNQRIKTWVAQLKKEFSL